MTQPESWLRTTPAGLWCEPADIYIDPITPVSRAAITHGHGDHARPGHGQVLATPETLAIMQTRFGAAGNQQQSLSYGVSLSVGGVMILFVPAGHILGSAQIVLEHAGSRIVVSGDYKRRADPTCPPFHPVPCDVFVTEATFGLPVFNHPEDRGEIARLLDSLRLSPDRPHLVGVYALGKAQRMMKLLRAAGWDRPFWLHGALLPLTELYRSFGCEFGDMRPATGASAADLAGQIILAPPSAIAERWSRRLGDPINAVASGWMGIRARARQRGAALPLVISDHADWSELTTTLEEVGAPRVWVTHGREDALVHWAKQQGIHAEALSLVGYDEEER